MNRLIWTRDATADLDSITDYLDREAPGICGRLFAVIDRRADLLIDFPYLGAFISELGLRKLTLTGFPYLSLYHVDDAAISVVPVVHAKQNWR